MEVFFLLMLIVVTDGVSIGSHHRRGEHLCRKSHDLLETAINEERKAKQQLLECVNSKKEQIEYNEENFVKRDDYISVQQTLHDEIEARNKLERFVTVLQTQVSEIQLSVTLISGQQKMINELKSQNKILERNLSTALGAIQDLNKKSDEWEEKSLKLKLKFDSSEEKRNQLKLDVDATQQRLGELMSLRNEFDEIRAKTKRIGKPYKNTCETDISCVEGLMCRDTLCECDSLRYWNGLLCAPRKAFKETCQADDHCMEGLNCKNRRCECKESSRYWNGSVCVPSKNFNESCHADIHCMEGLVCKSRRCDCKESLKYWNGSTCVARKTFKQICETDINCVEGLVCLNSRCQCKRSSWSKTLCSSAPTECADLDISEPGVYTVYTADITPYDVYCKIVDGVKWTVFQRREDGSVNFNRKWIEYKNGFGKISGEFWLGNDFINQLSSNGPHRLRVELTKQGRTHHASYSNFMVDNESKNYRLTVTGYTGNAGDSLNTDSYANYKHNGMEFTTWDNDNDRWSGNCAARYGSGSGWWYNACDAANLNTHPGMWAYDLGSLIQSSLMMTRK